MSAGGTPENYGYAYDRRVGTYFRCVGQVEVDYHTWQPMTLGRYDAIILSVVFSVTASSNSDPWTISYSTNAGVDWSVMATGTGLSTFDPDTESLDIATDLADLQVKVECPDGKTIRVYEIYTIGCVDTSPSASPSLSASLSPSASPSPEADIWSTIPQPVRPAPPDGIMVDGTEDGGWTPPRGDGFFVPDGTWTPIVFRFNTWATITQPISGRIYLADGTWIADGSITPGGSNWVKINVE